MPETQLNLITPPPANADADWFVAFLCDREWTTARAVLELCGLPVNEDNKRWIRKLADESKGRIAGHQKGYKLTGSMTGDEYQHWRNEWLKAVAAIEARIAKSDTVFYARQPIAADN